MSANDFRATFQKVSSSQLPPAPSSAEIAAQLIRRDQRRTWILAAISLSLWLVGTAGMLLLIFGLNRLVIFIRVADSTVNPLAVHAGDHPAPNNERPATSISKRDEAMLEGTSLIHHSLPLVGGAVVALLLAAMFTVLLIFSSRRATLNRINVSLAQIAEQLNALPLQSSTSGQERAGSKSDGN